MMEASEIVTSQTNNDEQTTDSSVTGDASVTDENTDVNANTAEAESTDTSGNADESESNDSTQTYADFDLPKGLEMNAELLEQAIPVFQELGLSQEQAQKLVDIQAKHIEASQQGQQDAFNQLKLDWIEQAKNDKEIGGDKFDENVATAKDALSKFGNEGLTKLLNDFGIGNHPDVIRFMANIGRLTKEDNPDNSGQVVKGENDRVSVLYPK